MRKNQGRSRPRRSRFLRLNNSSPRPLSFDDGERGPPPRVGDLRPEEEVLEEFPPSRVREAGLTGGPLRQDVTADDLSPETLLDDRLSRTPSAHDDREALDTLLSDVPESAIGAGEGLDEAEDAEADRMAPAEHGRRQQEADRMQRKGLRSK